MKDAPKQPIKPPEGLKKQIFGTVLIVIGACNIIAAASLGYALDIFYPILILTGILFLLYGTRQRKCGLIRPD